MKICIFVRVLWPGGVQAIAFSEAKSLEELGHKVDLVFLRDSGRGVYPWSYLHSFKVMYNSSISKRPLHKLFWLITRQYNPERGEDSTVDLDLIKKFEKTRDRYDVVIYFDQLAAFYANLGKRIHRDRYIVNIMETGLKENDVLRKYILNRAIRDASAIITIGKKNFDVLNNRQHKKVYLLYPGTYPKIDSPGFQQRENRILSITMWDRGRHPEIFLEIAKVLENETVYLLGDWTDYSYFNEFVKRVKSFGLENKIVVTGKVTREVLEENYRLAKVLVRFGYNEFGPGMATLEAISFGIPLIINNDIGIKDMIDSMGCDPSILVDQADPDEIALAIKKLTQNEREWQLKSKNALSLAEKISWEDHGKKLERILTEIMTEN